MVLQKMLDYGFNGYSTPQIPRATRSARRRCSFRKKIDENPMCAFDLLATVAGKLLEKESSPSSGDRVVKNELYIEDNETSKFEARLGGNLVETSCVSELISQAPFSHHSSKDFPHFHEEAYLGLTSVVTTSDCLDKVGDLKIAKNKILLGSFASDVEEPCHYALDNENKEQVELEVQNAEKVSITSMSDMYISGTRIENKGHVPSDSVTMNGREDVKLAIRDNDENISHCNKHGTGIKAIRLSPHVGNQQIVKLLASKYWKVTSKAKEGTHYKADSEMKPSYQCRKNCYKRQRSQRDYPFKKRRLYNYSSASNSEGGNNGDNIVSLPRKEFSFDASDSVAKVNGGAGKSAGIAGQPTSLQSRNSSVKLRIKSFKVPELFIEIPETATVGSLKRTVMEAVTAVLGGGLRVGVLLQGKKIRDDNRTLQQTGISRNDMPESLGFSLEPNSTQTAKALQHEDCPSLLSVDAPQQLKRYPPSRLGVFSVAQPRKIDSLSDPPTNLGNFIESNHDPAPSPPDMPPDKMPVDLRALVAVPAMNAEALSMVPLKKSKRSDAAQRRIRRPFSVSEVEALVQAVEKLGTGRWRDVKLRAFDNAKHRTYVDLKTKFILIERRADWRLRNP